MAETASKKAELKEPDPFLRFTIQLWDGIHARRKEIGVVLVLLLVAAIVFAAVTAHQQNVKAQAGAALSEALRVATRPVKGEDSDTTDSSEPPFKTEQEKQTALAAALKDVIAKHPGTEAARDALLPLGDAELKLGQYDDAKKDYSNFVTAASDDPPLRALAELGIAKADEEKKDWAAAAQDYENLQRDAPGKFLKDRAALGKARMLELTGKKQEAAQAYADVKNGYAGTDAAREASDRLALLESQGFKPAQPAVPQANSTVPQLPLPPKAE